jgi:nucleotide-binding universal stress UspA family protein
LEEPATKIAEMAEKHEIDLIFMGRKGLGHTQNNVGHTEKVLQITARPVILIKMIHAVTKNRISSLTFK